MENVDSEIAAQFGANASALGQANLADDHLAGLNFLATIQLNTEALTWAVVYVFT